MYIRIFCFIYLFDELAEKFDERAKICDECATIRSQYRKKNFDKHKENLCEQVKLNDKRLLPCLGIKKTVIFVQTFQSCL